MIFGYKCFNKDLVNRYGTIFEIGKEYHEENDIKFQCRGFHMCANLEDTLRYFDAMHSSVDIAKVVGYGNINEYDDDYNGFYNMYAAEYLKILYVLSRDEIINYALNLSPERAKRFVSLYKLNNEEIVLFQERYRNMHYVLDAIEYYQLGNDKIYQKRI